MRHLWPKPTEFDKALRRAAAKRHLRRIDEALHKMRERQYGSKKPTGGRL